MILLASRLKSAEFGRISFAQVVAIFVTRFSEFGLETYGAREIASNKEHEDRLVINIFAIRGTLSLLFFFLTYVFLKIVSLPSINEATRNDCFIFLLTIFTYIYSLEWYYQGKEKMGYIGLSRITRSFLFLTFIVVLSLGVGQEYEIGYCFVISNIIASLILLIPYWKSKTKEKYVPTRKSVMSIFQLSLHLGLASILMQIPFNFGTIAVGIFRSDEEVGMYSASYKVASVIWTFGVIAVYNSFFPTLSYLYTHNRSKLPEVVFNLTRYLIVAAIGISSGSILFSESLLHLIYNGKFDSAIFVFENTFFLVSIVLARAGIEYVQIAMHEQNKYLFGVVLVSLLYFIFDTILIPKYGINGALIGALSAEVVYSVFLYVRFRLFPISKIISYLTRAGIAGGVTVLMLTFLPLSLHIFPKFLLFTFLYAVLLFIVKAITKKDYVIIQDIIKPILPRFSSVI